MNKRRRYLAKRRRAEWNKLHIKALTYWSTLPEYDDVFVEFAAKLVASQVDLPDDMMQVLRTVEYGEA